MNDMRVHVRKTVMCALALLAACTGGAPSGPLPIEVNAVTLAVRPLPLDLRYSARTRGEREVEVRARVSGILLRRNYHEGESVAADALLFKIDPAPFLAEASRLRGLEAVEKARLIEATAQRDRLQALFEEGVVSRAELDAVVAAHATALALVRAATAAVRQAELNLSYTDVRAPIAGTTGREMRSEGSLIAADGPSSLLTTIVQSERLYVDFSLPEQEAQLVQAAMRAPPVTVRLAPGGAGEMAQAATLEFLDTRIDADSGTVPARAVLDNHARLLAPGQFVVARIEGLLSAPAIHVPLRAVLHTQDGAMVWAVDAESKAQARPVRLGPAAGNVIEVTDGVQAGDRVIVDGILKVQPGTPVKAIAVDGDDSPGGPLAARSGAAVPRP